MYQRGHAVPDDSRPYLPERVEARERAIAELEGELSGALSQLGGLRSDISALLSLLHVVNISLVVQDDVHQLCHAVAAVSEAFSSSLETYSARARAAERGNVRARRR